MVFFALGIGKPFSAFCTMVRVDLKEPLAVSRSEGNGVNAARNFPRFFPLKVGGRLVEADAIVDV